jgi:hypothetical protein
MSAYQSLDVGEAETFQRGSAGTRGSSSRPGVAGPGYGRRALSVLAVLLALVGTAFLVSVRSQALAQTKTQSTKVTALAEAASAVDGINFEETFNPT